MKFNHLNVPDHWRNYWSRYPEGYTILEALISWVSQVDKMVDNVNEWNTYLDGFVEQFDTELQTTVETTLSDWQKSGFLDVVINEALETKIDDLATTTNEQLLGKRDKHVPIGVNDLDGETLAYLEGAGGNTIEVLSIPRNYSVTHEKTTFFKTEGNLFNKEKTTPKSVLGDTGELVTNSGYQTSDFIPVVAGQTYSTTNVRKVAFYDELQKHITPTIDVVTLEPQKVTATQNGYLRVTIKDNHVNTGMVVEGNTLPDKFIPFSYILKTDTKITKDNIIGKLSADNMDFFNSRNLFNKEVATKDHVLVSNGTVAQSDRTIGVYDVSDYITVTPGKYAVSINRNIAIYNENKSIISFIDNPGLEENIVDITQPGYIRVTFNQSRIDTSYVYRSEAQGDYVPFGKSQLSENIVITSANLSDDLKRGGVSKKTSIHFGDSITANGTIVEKIADITGFNTFNFGVGATRLIDIEPPATGYQRLNFLDLLRAKVTGDWLKVDEGVSLINDPAVTERIEILKALDMSTVDYLSFMYGTNDINNVDSLGAPDSTDSFTTSGAMNFALETIMTNYPHIRVFVFAPIFRPVMSGTDNLNSDEYAPNGQIYLYEIGDTMGERAKAFKTPFKHMYYESGINKYNWKYYIKDGTHPNTQGDELMAEVIGRFILSN